MCTLILLLHRHEYRFRILVKKVAACIGCCSWDEHVVAETMSRQKLVQVSVAVPFVLACHLLDGIEGIQSRTCQVKVHLLDVRGTLWRMAAQTREMGSCPAALALVLESVHELGKRGGASAGHSPHCRNGSSRLRSPPLNALVQPPEAPTVFPRKWRGKSRCCFSTQQLTWLTT